MVGTDRRQDLLINKKKMKLNKTISGLLPLLVLLGAAFSSCHKIHEDLPPCPRNLRFAYTYNMKFADAFAREMTNQSKAKQMQLYIYDREGRFLSSRTVAGNDLAANSLPLDLAPGTYQFMAWGGLDEADYTWSTPQPGDLIGDWKMAVNPDAATPANTVSRELPGLFHGQKELTLPLPEEEGDILLPLVKNTNKLRLVLIDTDSGTFLVPAYFTVEATTVVSDLNAANEPLTSNTFTWHPYYTGTGKVNGTDGKPTYSAAIYELNTLRLLDGTATSLRIIQQGETTPFLSVDLTGLLLLTRMESQGISTQEYLDRQDEYTILVYLDRKDGKAHYLQIIVNDWTIRLDDINLGKEKRYEQ